MSTWRPRKAIVKIDAEKIADLDDFIPIVHEPVFLGGGRLKQVAIDNAKTVDDMFTLFREAEIGNRKEAKKLGKAYIECESDGMYADLDMTKTYDIWTSDDGRMYCTLGVKIVGEWHGYIVCDNGRLCRGRTSKIFYTE